MRIQNISFSSEDEAVAARVEFPQCSNCGSALKIQQVEGGWHLLCVRRPGHTIGIAS